MKSSDELHTVKPTGGRPTVPGGLWAILACAAITLVALPLRGWLHPANLLVLYVLPVLWVSAHAGWLPGVLAAFLGVLAFDVLLVPPYYSLRVEDTQYLVGFAMLLAVALVVGRLTAQLKAQAQAAGDREARTQALFDLARELLGASDAGAVEQALDAHSRRLWHCRAQLLLADAHGQLQPREGGTLPSASVLSSARALFDAASHGKALPEASSAANTCLVALPGHGVLLLAGRGAPGFSPAGFLGAWAALASLALDRIHYAGLAHQAGVAAESERLRNAILAAVSHDLRTPIAALAGLAQTLSGRATDAGTAELCRAIEDEAWRMDDITGNLLQLARLQSGAPLDAQLQMLDESVGPALSHMERELAAHQLHVEVEDKLPLLRFDAVLIERVLCNLLSNAGRQAPPGSRIRLAARTAGAGVEVCVEDEGPGMKADALARLQSEEDAPSGAGLGLWICQRILRAHGSRLEAVQREQGGMRFSFTLPAQPQPGPGKTA